jgi:putative ATPase
VFRLRPLSAEQLVAVLDAALTDSERGLGTVPLNAEPDFMAAVASSARGDARRALNLLEALAAYAEQLGHNTLSVALLAEFNESPALLYDKAGEEHYNVTSALIKSMRGSDPDAAVYWMTRMVEAGDDPLFVLRRFIIFASEDVGNADPRALEVAVNGDQAFRRLGMPEGWYPLTQVCVYLACCPKSNRVGAAMKAARSAVAEHGALPVPLKLRNAAGSVSRAEGYGQGYQYPHDHQGHHVAGETYLPDALAGTRFYEPSNEGLEQHIRSRLARLSGQEQASDNDAKPSPKDE